MRLVLLFLILLPIFVCAQNDLILYPEKGVGAVRVDKTTEDQVKKIYGPNYKIDTSYQDNLLVYPSLGLKFRLDPKTHKVIFVIAYKDFKGKTEKILDYKHLH